MIRGVHINDKELQRIMNNSLAKEMRTLAKAGESALEEVTQYSISQFYKTANSGHWYSSIPSSVKTKRNNFKQNNQYVWCDIDVYIDEENYYEITEPFYHIYNWVNEHGKTQSWGSRFVIWLQWNKGIVGLPDPYPNYHGGNKGIKGYVMDEIERAWIRKTRKNRKSGK